MIFSKYLKACYQIYYDLVIDSEIIKKDVHLHRSLHYRREEERKDVGTCAPRSCRNKNCKNWVRGSQGKCSKVPVPISHRNKCDGWCIDLKVLQFELEGVLGPQFAIFGRIYWHYLIKLQAMIESVKEGRRFFDRPVGQGSLQGSGCLLVW